jgi:hypothetical protein
LPPVLLLAPPPLAAALDDSPGSTPPPEPPPPQPAAASVKASPAAIRGTDERAIPNLHGLCAKEADRSPQS